MSQNRRSHEERLSTIFKYFVDVVRINIFITTATGQSLITPEPNPYGWKLLAEASDIKTKFKQSGDYLEYVDKFHLNHFAIPVRAGYVVIGPLIINKKMDRQQYMELAVKAGCKPDDILDSIDEIRVVSQNQLKSILDLIWEAKEFFIGEPEPAHQDAMETVENLNMTLKGLLETALGMVNGQSGSIMLYQEDRGLRVQVSKGINPQFSNKTIKLGDGISGQALKENRTLVLTDKGESNRITQLLKRKEIKQSIVMPFENAEKTIRGVLNLNIVEDQSILKETSSILSKLTQITQQTLQAV